MTAECVSLEALGGHRPPLQMSGSGQLFLDPLHLSGGPSLFVVESMEVKETVGDVEPHLMVCRRAEAPRLPPRGLGADENLAVLKSDDVRRARFLKKTAMQFRHAPIGNKHDAHFFERSQHAVLWAPQLQTPLQRRFREALQHAQFYGNFSLPINHDDFWLAAIHEESNRGLRG